MNSSDSGDRIFQLSGSTPCMLVPGLLIFNSLRPRQMAVLLTDDIFKCIFLNENVLTSIKISLKFVPKGQINNIPTLVQVMAWRRPGDKPLSEPMMVILLTHICVARPQWVNISYKNTWWSVTCCWLPSFGNVHMASYLCGYYANFFCFVIFPVFQNCQILTYWISCSYFTDVTSLAAVTSVRYEFGLQDRNFSQGRKFTNEVLVTLISRKKSSCPSALYKTQFSWSSWTSL